MADATDKDDTARVTKVWASMAGEGVGATDERDGCWAEERGAAIGTRQREKEREVKVRVRKARVRKQVSHLLRYSSDDHHFSGVLSFGGAKVQSGSKGRVGHLVFQPESDLGCVLGLGFSLTLRRPLLLFLPPAPLAAFSFHRSSTGPRRCSRTTVHTHAPSRQAQAVARRPTTPARRRPAQRPTASSSPCPSSNSSSCVLLPLFSSAFSVAYKSSGLTYPCWPFLVRCLIRSRCRSPAFSSSEPSPR